MTAPTQDRDQALPRKRGRSVPAIYGVVSLVLVALALTFALSSPPPSTPPLAEVAPAPQDQIEVERVEQSSQFGEGQGGEGDCEVGADCDGVGEQQQPVATDPTPPPPTADPNVSQAEFRGCYHGGRTQSPDPQSPACVPTVFVGDNGGETWTGVTRDTIRIAVPSPVGANFANNSGESAREENRRADLRVLRAFADHVEQYYELYGRRLELVEVELPEGDGPAAERAYAQTVAAVGPFAVLEFEDGSIPFYDATSDLGIVALDPGRKPVSDAAVYDRFHPYVWGVYPSVEQVELATGDLICSSLAGRPARHAGSRLSTTVRSFAVIAEQAPGRAIPPDVLARRLEACQTPHRVYTHAVETDDPEALVRRIQADGHTTVVCLCEKRLGRYTDPATASGFVPEWLAPGLADVAARLSMISGVDREQRAHVFGLWPDFRDPARSGTGPATSHRWEEFYWHHALKEQDSGFEFDRLNSDIGHKAYRYYAQFLILAAGIQAAGAELTPHTFGDGLTGQRFANPGVGQHPWFQPAVGVGRSDHTLNSDFALLWWDNTTQEEEQARHGTGDYCYVGGGQRFTSGTFPTGADELFFDPEAGCR